MRMLAPAAAPLSAGRRLLRVFSLVRYRFFLFAGLLPYLLGAAWAFSYSSRFDAALFWMGLGGVALSVVGVEAFNEYFDADMSDEHYETVGGLILHELGRLPRRAEVLDFGGFRFKVARTDRRRIHSVEVTRLAASA